MYGGWRVSGILYLRSGLPLTITQSGTMLSTGITNNRPDTIGDPTLDNPTIDMWFNTAAFARVPETTATFGNTGRNTVRGPGQFNIDFSVIKLTRFGKVETEFRIEAFNLLNHPQFAQPRGSLATPRSADLADAVEPACSLCGTTERQIQIGVKAKF